MSATTKATIRDRAASGLPLHPADIVRVNRQRCVVTQRHVWRDDEHGPVLDAVSSISNRAMKDLAEETGRPAELYSADGCLLGQAIPGVTR